MSCSCCCFCARLPRWCPAGGPFIFLHVFFSFFSCSIRFPFYLIFCTLPSKLCAHHDDTSTHVDCSARLTTKSHHTLVRLHCSCTSHGIVLNASRNLYFSISSLFHFFHLCHFAMLLHVFYFPFLFIFVSLFFLHFGSARKEMANRTMVFCMLLILQLKFSSSETFWSGGVFHDILFENGMARLQDGRVS